MIPTRDDRTSSEPTPGTRRFFDEQSGDSPSAEDSSTPRRSTGGDRRTRSSGFGTAVLWTILGTVVPGVGLLKAGRKVTGIIALVLFLGSGLTLGAVALFNPKLIVSNTNATVLTALAIALLGIGLLWVLIIVATHLALRPRTANRKQRIVSAILVGALALVVAVPSTLGANVAYTISGMVTDIFAPVGSSDNVPVIDVEKPDPWADIPQLNVLIIGGDTGGDRKGEMRADSVIVASIDTKTGATTLFSLPRQTARVPFPKDSPLHKLYPKGWYDASHGATWSERMLNAMYNILPAELKRKGKEDILGKTQNLGADAMKQAVGEALGLDISYYVAVNMDGFKDVINALGGITLNVSYPVPVGGKNDPYTPPKRWLHPGPNQHFNGTDALWFARGRFELVDYNRMEQQRCVINAVVQQVNPMNVLSRFQSLAEAGKKTFRTDVPQDVLPAIAELALRMQGTKMRSVVFVHNEDGFSTLNPDWDVVRERVKTALKETSASNTAPGSSTTPSTKSKSDDVDNVCGYNPKRYQELLKEGRLAYCERSDANYKKCFGKKRD